MTVLVPGVSFWRALDFDLVVNLSPLMPAVPAAVGVAELLVFDDQWLIRVFQDERFYCFRLDSLNV